MGWGFLWGESRDNNDLPPCPGLNDGPCSAGSVAGQVGENATCPPCTTKKRKWHCEYVTNPPFCCSYYTCEPNTPVSSIKNKPCTVG